MNINQWAITTNQQVPHEVNWTLATVQRFLQLFVLHVIFCLYWWAGFRIRITLMRIPVRIQLFTLLRILIQLFTSVQFRIWILLLNKVMRICERWTTDPPGLHFESPRLHFEHPLPSTAPVWALITPEFWLYCGSGSSFSLKSGS